MTDEAPAETQDTPDDAAPSDGTPAPEATEASQPAPDTNWQQRYESLQPEYTRATQESAQLRQIIELARQGDREAIEWLGLELDDADDDTEDTEAEYRDPRVDELLAERAERQQEAQLDSLESHVNGEIDALCTAAGIEDLSDDEKDLIFGALTPNSDDPSVPDVAKAFKKVTGLRDAHIKSYVAGKLRRPSAPSGSSPSHQPDLDDPEQRREYIASRMRG